MSRIPLVSLEDMTAEERAQYDRFPSNLTRALLLADRRLAQAPPELANALRAAELEPRLREAVTLRVAALEGSAYVRMQHLEQARQAGLSDGDISTLEAGEPPPELMTLVRFVDACVTTGDVPATNFDAALSELGVRKLATVLLLIGHYMMIARFTNVLRLDLDEHAATWEHEH